MALLATQPVTPTGLDLAHTNASIGGDLFTPGDDVLLHLVNTSGSPVTVTVVSSAHVLEEDVVDVLVTVPANGQQIVGPFPAPFFANPADGQARVTYSDAAHTQVAAAGTAATPAQRATVVSIGASIPADLSSGQLWLAAGDLYVAPSAIAPTSGAAVISGTAEPTDLDPGTVYLQRAGDGTPLALFLAPGMSAADVRIAAVAPTDLVGNQLAIVVGADGVATDLYVGGLT